MAWMQTRGATRLRVSEEPLNNSVKKSAAFYLLLQARIVFSSTSLKLRNKCLK